jgi:SAM-dependent methyltransferase
MNLTLEQSTALYSLLADASRLRLLLLLESHELSVAELTEITGLAQSRVSTHLSRLKRAGLVQDKRVGAAALYSAHGNGDQAQAAWDFLRGRIVDAQARLDLERAEELIRTRKHGQTWAESVAGRMELYYSPGRTWEATSRALIGLMEFGDVLDLACGDGVMAELVAGHARSITCVDISPTVIAAARKRLASFSNVRFHEGDMHALPFKAASYDHVFAMHALSYSQDPKKLLKEASRLLRPKGRLVVAALNAHHHEAAMQSYDHVNLGVSPDQLRRLLEQSGFAVEMCQITSRESKPPYFEVVTALARKT